MGTYLSTPETEKSVEEGEDRTLRWAVVDMQGWRKTMEDAHIADTEVQLPSSLTLACDNKKAKVFCVFDGHGGCEVARFCQLYFVDVLVNQEHWKGNHVDIGKALASAYHFMDELIDDISRRDEIQNLRIEKPKPGERRSLIPASQGISSPNVVRNGSTMLLEQNSVRHIPITQVSNDSSEKNDDDSDTQVGYIADDRLDINGDSDADDESDKTNEKWTPEETATLFKSLLAIKQGLKFESLKKASPEDANSDSALLEVEMEFKATKILNGRQVCNLPDHPIPAGCTAVCAVITDKVLTVANAGDSRVVLCRADGFTEPMSFDHKPVHDVEFSRIREAGGFVNNFGRVNGNLNLSRSIGDLKYKQVPNIAPSAQMITAEPDIKQITLDSDDEFLILACDGIWDCLTNEEAVKFVMSRIDTQTPADIGKEMLDSIISVDPRATQGVGGDNMTVMIVDLKPHTRSWCQ